MTSGGITKRNVLRYCSAGFFVAAMIFGFQYASNGQPGADALAALAFTFGVIMIAAFWAAGLPKRKPNSDEDEWSRSIR